MPFRKDYRSWILDVRKKSKIQNLTSKIFKAKQGFTLIELMITITLIAVLSSVGYFNYKSAQQRGRDLRRKQDFSLIKSALLSYYQDNGLYPATCSASGCAADGTTTWIPGIGGTSYARQLPNDPQGTNGNCTAGGGYCYMAPADQSSFTLWTTLENTSDAQRYNGNDATCTQTPPTGSTFNYCMESPK
ncbi:MAG TPA: prepilin-type N-terminal cleavage/methylation domain-containing protein [Candidatus Saccharimonadales bacterium]|nr:prepilin-type N-terminal cleavage/methylation domain-containing protein [Candidatus Saccharimonadales bacterium]